MAFLYVLLRGDNENYVASFNVKEVQFDLMNEVEQKYDGKHVLDTVTGILYFSSLKIVTIENEVMVTQCNYEN